MTRYDFLAALLAGVLTMLPSEEAADGDAPIPLRLSPDDAHDATVHPIDGGTVEVRTTGTDPYAFTEPIATPLDPAALPQHMLAFEYFSATGTDGGGGVQIFLDPPIREAHSVSGPGLPHSEGWSSVAFDLRPALSDSPERIRRLRIDFGSSPGKTIQIRSLRLRPQTDVERRLAARKEAQRAAEKRREDRLKRYLAARFPATIASVAVDAKTITVRGNVGGERGELWLAEAPLYVDVTETATLATPVRLTPGARGDFAATIDRHAADGWDRLLSRWAVVRRTNAKTSLLSHARYADSVVSRAAPPKGNLRGKKGIGGFNTGGPVSDLKDLGIAAVTVNIVLNGLFHMAAGPGRTPFSFAGQAFYADDARLAGLDETLRVAAKNRCVVSGILLIAQAQTAPPESFAHRIAHPDADPAGIFPMPDVASRDGLIAYAAGLNFLCERYSRPDGRFGRLHHWILHNEVNAGWVWTNAGEKTALLYLDLYQRSMRTAHLLMRQYDPNAQAFISLEHHWTLRMNARCYTGRELLDHLLAFSAAEGDFDWGIAHHPYPQNLFEPRVWADTEVDSSFDTPKITFKNVAVLDAWVRQPRARFLGKTPRTIHLTEQGLNARDYSEASLRDQAAGMAYAWNRFKHLDTIAVFHYHNWIDNRGEGGLRIGLRRFPDDKDDPLGRKPIWFVYQALETPREAEATEFAKGIIGIRDWDEVALP